MTDRGLPLARALALASLVCACLLPAAPAHAQAARLGGSILVGQGSIRYADVGYDPVNDAYLVVSGAERVIARFVAADGTVLGNVVRVPDADRGGYAPRVAYSRDLGGFLVTWLDSRGDPLERTNVRGRFVKYDGGNVLMTSGDFALASANGGSGAETSAAVAYSTQSREFLVVWKQYEGGLNNVYGQRLGIDGTRLGAEFPLTFDVHWQDDPAVDYDPGSNSFFVVWQHYTEPRGPGGVQGRRVDAGTGTLHAAVTLFTGLDGYTPDVTFHPGQNRHLVSYFSGGVHYGMFVDASGTVIRGAQPLVSGSPSYNAWDVAYNAKSGTFLAVRHGAGTEDMGVEVDGNGVPTGHLQVTSNGATDGNYNPRVAGRSSSSEWMVAVQSSMQRQPFSSLAAQRVQTGTACTGDCGGGGTPPPPPPPPPTDPTHISLGDAPNGSSFFAEGFASSDAQRFNTYYQILNDHDEQAATVRAYFARQTSDGTVSLKERRFEVPKRSRVTIELRHTVGDGAWSSVFQSLTPGVPITAQQSVFWGANFEGSSTATAARSAGPVWLFAEGTRVAGDYFANFFLLFNPGTQPISVLGEYYGPGATTPIVKSYVLPPSSRFTILANAEIPELANKDFSARFRAADGASPFVAQRAMYFGPNWVGGHSSNGVQSASPTWLFAEGAVAPDFDTFFTLLNPNPFPVDVQVTYLTELRGAISRGENFQLPPNSRGTIHANGELGNIGAFGAAFNAVGGHGIVVERSIYWGPGGFPNWIEGTNEAGANAPAMTWYLPEGSDGGTFDTFVLIANPHPVEVSVLVQFFLEGGGRISVPGTVRAGSRLTIDMNQPRAALPAMSAGDAQLLQRQSFAVKVTSLTPSRPILVEEAIYRDWRDNTRWRAGSSAFGIPR